MATINTTSFPALLIPGANEIFGDYNVYQDLWNGVFSRHTSDKAVEYDYEMQGLGLSQQKAEGAPTVQGYMQQGYTTAYRHQYYSNSFTMTRAAILDNLYAAQFPQYSLQLRNAQETLKNMNAMYIFNNAFNANSTGGDGTSLCNTQHPIATGFIPNTFNTGVGLTETAIEDAITIIRTWRNLAGLQVNYRTIKMLVPQKQAFNVARILKSEYRTQTADNDINALVHDKYMPGGYIINPFILNGNSWFILTDCKAFKYFQREKLNIAFITDDLTDNVTTRVLERYSFNYNNFRGCFGSQG